MARGRSITYTAAEQTAVWLTIQFLDPQDKRLKPLRTLHDKMVKAREPGQAKSTWDFNVKRAMEIAGEIFGERLTYPPILVPAWYSNKNKYIAANGISEDTFLRGCKIAEKQWHGTVYFDTLLASVNKLVATDGGKIVKKTHTGHAAGEDFLDAMN